jgi:hypothetical protein
MDNGPGIVPFLIFLVVPALVVLAIILASYYSKKRKEEFAAVAAALGLEYWPNGASGMYPSDNSGCSGSLFGSFASNDPLVAMFEGFHPFGQGSARKSTDMLTGKYQGIDVCCFDYQYTISTGKSSATYHFGVHVAKLPLVFPATTIRHEGFGDKIVGAFGGRDIQFESEEFNKRYFVQSGSERFAYDLLHPQMIEYLLSMPEQYWQMSGQYLMIVNSGALQPEAVQTYLDALLVFNGYIPEFVRQDIGFAPAWTTFFA